MDVVGASQDWFEVPKYAEVICAQALRQEELVKDLYKTWYDQVCQAHKEWQML